MGSKARAQLPHGTQDFHSQTRDGTLVLCTERQILNHWTTRDVPQCRTCKTGFLRSWKWTLYTDFYLTHFGTRPCSCMMFPGSFSVAQKELSSRPGSIINHSVWTKLLNFTPCSSVFVFIKEKEYLTRRMNVEKNKADSSSVLHPDEQ